MPDRAAKFVSAIFVSALAGAALAAVTHNTARAADDCLAAPKGETPEGSHWYYRIERGSKRHCWYLRGEGEKLSQTAPPNSSAAAAPVAAAAAPVAAAPMQRSVADAHAEWPAQTSIEPPRRNDAQLPAMPANPAVSQDNAAVGADAPQSVVASRWPDSAAASSTASPQAAADQQSAADQLAANMQATNTQQAATMQSGAPSDSPPSDSSQSASPQSDSAPSDSAAAPPPVAAAVPLATADSPQALPASLPVLLAVMTGALALAGITASLVLKFGGARRTARLRVRRNQIWDSMDQDNFRLSAGPDADVVPRRPLPRDLDQAAEPNDRVAEFYAQLSKQARS
jgi:hypothetical protein